MGDKDNKCAPNKKYTDGSCFTLDSLINIAKSYNKSIKQSRTGRLIKIKKAFQPKTSGIHEKIIGIL